MCSIVRLGLGRLGLKSLLNHEAQWQPNAILLSFHSKQLHQQSVFCMLGRGTTRRQTNLLLGLLVAYGSFPSLNHPYLPAHNPPLWCLNSSDAVQVGCWHTWESWWLPGEMHNLWCCCTIYDSRTQSTVIIEAHIHWAMSGLEPVTFSQPHLHHRIVVLINWDNSHRASCRRAEYKYNANKTIPEFLVTEGHV